MSDPQTTVKRGRVIRERLITRSMVQAMPEALFVFGDNLERRGMGGQAGAMRGEPNAIGVPTKWKPGRTPDAYFSDADAAFSRVRKPIIQAFQYIETALASGRDVVIPADGLGTGLAQLPTRAPGIHRAIERRIANLSREPVADA